MVIPNEQKEEMLHAAPYRFICNAIHLKVATDESLHVIQHAGCHDAGNPELLSQKTMGKFPSWHPGASSKLTWTSKHLEMCTSEPLYFQISSEGWSPVGVWTNKCSEGGTYLLYFESDLLLLIAHSHYFRPLSSKALRDVLSFLHVSSPSEISETTHVQKYPVNVKGFAGLDCCLIVNVTTLFLDAYEDGHLDEDVYNELEMLVALVLMQL